jgi:ATP phosphoribosyltransferase
MKILKIAIQNSGRLSEKLLELIHECDINLTQEKRKLISASADFPLQILYLRDDDISQYIADCVADIGIAGENEVLQKAKKVNILKK